MIEKRNTLETKNTNFIESLDAFDLSFVEINCECSIIIEMRLNEGFEKLNFNIE